MRAVLVNTTTGYAENVIEYDPQQPYEPNPGFTLIVDQEAVIGSHWDGSVFTPPVPPTPGPSFPTADELSAMVYVAKTTVTEQINASTFPYDKVTEVKALFPAWAAGIAVNVGDIYTYNDTIVKCVQAHTTQADWTPDVTPALWTIYKAPNSITAWVQPTGAQDAYPMGALVTHLGKTWSSNVDANVWEPPTQWTEVVA